MRALELKLERLFKELDKMRKVEQAEMLQKFVNLRAKLQRRQGAELSKLTLNFEVKALKNKRVK